QELTAVIEQFVVDHAWREAEAARMHAYTIAYHDYPAVARRYEQILAKGMGREDAVTVVDAKAEAPAARKRRRKVGRSCRRPSISGALTAGSSLQNRARHCLTRTRLPSAHSRSRKAAVTIRGMRRIGSTPRSTRPRSTRQRLSGAVIPTRSAISDRSM